MGVTIRNHNRTGSFDLGYNPTTLKNLAIHSFRVHRAGDVAGLPALRQIAVWPARRRFDVSETATQPAPPRPALPLFFDSVVGVNVAQHSHLRINRSAGFGFAARAQAMPLGLGEFEAAAQHYPIVFAAGPTPTPMVLLGLREGDNLFVEPGGAWRRDAYIPAYGRAYPFIFVEDTAKAALFVAMDPGANAISSTEGSAMFEDGKPSPAMNETITFCAAFRDNLNAAIAFGRAMQEAGVLAEEEASISFTAGGTARVNGFKLIKPDRLAAVPDEVFLEWRRSGWLGAIYAHLHSASRWGRLVELTTPPPAG